MLHGEDSSSTYCWVREVLFSLLFCSRFMSGSHHYQSGGWCSVKGLRLRALRGHGEHRRFNISGVEEEQMEGETMGKAVSTEEEVGARCWA